MSAETLASVSQLHERRDEAATYWHFYEEYGTARAGAAILLNRILHKYEPLYRVIYDPREIWVTSTDGETISAYHTRSVHGIYTGDINEAYNPAAESINVEIVSRDTSEVGLVKFNLATGQGSFSLGERALGWILDPERSAELRNVALNPEGTAPIHGVVAS